MPMFILVSRCHAEIMCEGELFCYEQNADVRPSSPWHSEGRLGASRVLSGAAIPSRLLLLERHVFFFASYQYDN